MSELDPDRIRGEAVERIVDLAIAANLRNRPADAVGRLVEAAGSNAELLTAATETADELAGRTGRDAVRQAAADLRSACRAVDAEPPAPPDPSS